MEHMNESRLALVVGLALVIAWLVVRSSRSRWVHSDVTGRSYRVLDLPDAQEAADALASLELAAEQFLTDAESVAPGDPRLANVRERWSRRLREIDGSDNIAYTVTKRDVSLCVRRPGGGAVYDDPRSGMFVLLHELAHVANDGWGHGRTFWDDFQWVLELADRTKAYAYQNFESTPKTYCGKDLTSSPLTCVKNGSCKPKLNV